MFRGAGFPTSVTANIAGWMLGHTAFVVPIAFALYQFDTDASALAADSTTLRMMVRATHDAFQALDDAEIPANLRWLYCRTPTALAVRYWRRVFASPRGELWFGAHSRAAPEEMYTLANELHAGGKEDRSANAEPRHADWGAVAKGDETRGIRQPPANRGRFSVRTSTASPR